MKKQLAIALLMTSVGASMSALAHRGSIYEGVEAWGKNIEKYAGNVEDALESFVKENNLKQEQIKAVKINEDRVSQQTHNIVKKIQKCYELEKNCVNIQSSVNSGLGMLDQEFDNLQANARKFLKTYPSATMLSEKVNFELNQLSDAIAQFNEKVEAFMEQHR
ncbi:MAG TPA: hypothetical protein PLU71_04085 [Candidatus Dependentiae bacterium]|nr:hypothetical protein [Candidatus Dependentiae bacterium]HRQ63012.1 hypothetical protein [Candidatus Dependentiae bacterium]